MSKVIATSDSRLGESGQTAYFRGQIFELSSNIWPFNDEIIIWNHNFGLEMVCPSKDFIPLIEWRQERIRQILISDSDI